MQRRDFLQSMMAAAAAVSAGFAGVRPALGSAGIPAAVPATAPAFSKEVSDTVRMVCGLLRECRITEVIRRGENLLQITYERDGKRRHDGPLFDWIEAKAHPRSIVVSSSVDNIDVTHLGDPFGFKSLTPIVQVEVEWFVSDIEKCPILGYHEVS